MEQHQQLTTTPVPDGVRIAKAVLVGAGGLVFLSALPVSAINNRWDWSTALWCSGIGGSLAWWAWNIWNRRWINGAVSNFAEIEFITVAVRKRKALLAILATLFLVGFTDTMQFLDGTLEEKWWLALLWLIPGGLYTYIVRYNPHKRIETTPVPVEKTPVQLEEEAIAERKSRELEDKWWYRYPMAILMLGGAIYLNDANPKVWWLAVLLGFAAILMMREILILLLALGAGWLLYSGITALPVSVAIIIGAIIIASAIK